MDYEKKYKETLERAKQLLGTSVAFDRFTIERIFPELKENKDNRIMRVIRGWIYSRPASFFDNGISKEEILAWLEKQCKKDVRQEFLEDLLVADDIYQMAMNDTMVEEARTKAIEAISKIGISQLLGIEKQGEQKTIDKSETKFKIEKGKWYVCIKDLLDNYANKAFHEGDTYLSTQDGSLIPSNSNVPFEVVCPDTYFRDWTLQDAKDGDVLATSAGAFIYNGNNGGGSCPGSYCGIDTRGNFKVGVEHHWTGKPVFPATKEQRHTLMKAMTDVGCIFDFEKKELKKLGLSEVTKTSDQEIGIAKIPFGAKDSELQEATYYIPKGFHAEIDDDKVVIKKGEKPTA